ncbi:hypothetical protein BO86DRAFT_394643 [Aspergillus japonicus CBS 114.51]|uniref:Nephrocystin 3-like N-terminal domain-containing protein n=1 Tax=Aspergillus japonicus CBS 114.51 TaxID=1448312 RepID=A0A8T8XEV3_ASPJA|nr:hypothetical protein BO86DRAFT_394643 [Aspergillus japonicus CBS 114.51]RAH86847.1 hypothetical protein BO86DRAFT_394643 [Aspergillus japonicus CBS 114.51]
MGSVNNSVENHGNNSGFWVGINHGHIHLASEKLPVAADAAFNAHGNDHLGCLPGTRTEILDAINKWAKSTSRESIFCWVTGGAGTGKSSIASEAARTLDKEGLLGASFFFKRVSELKPLLANAIEENPDIAERSLKEQWERLCLRPLLALEHDRTIARVVVIDALDECDSEIHRDDLTTILQLLPQVQQAKSLLLRFVLTGRPERSIGLALGKTEPYLYRVNLNNVHQQAIDRDIFTFLEHRLSEIRAQHQLDNGWPGNEALNWLLDRARPLFIAAVTLCRFIGDTNWDPEERLEAVLEDQTHYVSKLDEVYLPVLRQIT